MGRMTAGTARLAMAIAACAVLCGSEDSCESPHSVHSDEVSTGSMTAQITARAIGNGRTHVRVVLDAAGSQRDDVDLEGGDRLIAKHIDASTLNERSKVLIEQEDLDDFAYTGAFDSQAKDDTIEVSFDRSATGGIDAVGSILTMPTPFELDWVEDPVSMSAAPKTFSRSSDTPYFVVWDPFDTPDFQPGDELRFEVVGECIQRYFGSIDWQGGVDALPLTGVLLDRDPMRDGGACRLHVVFTLLRTGVVSPDFGGGFFVGKQVRELHLQSKP